MAKANHERVGKALDLLMLGQQQRRVARRVERHRRAVDLERADSVDRVDSRDCRARPTSRPAPPPPFLVARQGFAVDGDVAKRKLSFPGPHRPASLARVLPFPVARPLVLAAT